MTKYLALFDLDNTILDTNSGKLFVEQAHQNGLLRKRDFARAFFLLIGYKMGVLFPETIIQRMAKWLKGMPEQVIKDLAGQVFEQSLKDLIRDEARNSINEHRKKAGKTVILSAATDYICSLVQEETGMDDMICTEMEVENGVFSGFPVGKYCYGDEKLKRLSDYCAQNGYKLEEAWYYADSLSDLPVLEAVGHPVCVTPDPRLQKAAEERGWPIVQW